jgi:hypothetical protein
MPFIHDQATEVVEGAGFAGLDGDTRVGVGGAVLGFITQQARLRPIAPQRATVISAVAGVGCSDAPQVVLGDGA